MKSQILHSFESGHWKSIQQYSTVVGIPRETLRRWIGESDLIHAMALSTMQKSKRNR